MKKNRKTAVKVIAAILAVALVLLISFGGYIAKRFYFNSPETQNSYEEIYSQKALSLETDDNGLFRILKINDTHFFDGACENDKRTLEDLKIILDKTPCELIIVAGDLVDGFNLKSNYDKYKAISLFAQLIESYKIPWTFAPGNNDGEIDGENEDVIAYMMQYEHFICGNDRDIDGSMQFFIDIKNDKKLVHSIAVMDTGTRKIKAIGSYDYIKENQTDWLLDGIDERKVKTSVFFHMTTPAFQKAFDNGVKYDNFPSSDIYPMDEIKENEMFDNKTQSCEYITLLSAAHIHSDNMCSFYNNRYYQLSSAGGYSAGRNEEIVPSCTLITIDTNESNTESMYSFEKTEA